MESQIKKIEDFKLEQMNDMDILTILNAMQKHGVKNPSVIKRVNAMVETGKIKKINTLTNLLYAFAKMKEMPS